jgi:hypothetical protein
LAEFVRSAVALNGPGSAERNNIYTRNFQRLLLQAAARVNNAGGSCTYVGASNALTLSRTILKHLTENLNASQLVAFLDLPLSSGQDSVPEGPYEGLPAFCDHQFNS